MSSGDTEALKLQEDSKKDIEENKTSGESESRQNDKESLNLKVQSANSWETADLGDSKRNEKFLRLMGAAKKEHHGKFVIGDKPAQVRPRKDDEQLEEVLAEQYEQSMEHRLAGGRKGHLGLGFHPEEKPKDDAVEDVDEAVKADLDEEDGEPEPQDETNKTDDEKAREKDERRRDSSELKRENEDEDEAPVDAKKMKFVKSSS